ncbi:MAG: alpha/beta fold hydrolase [Chlamydiia bacterium]|nr:alpha/beta fold hydrolase [Chlamydiia bacterium]
MHETRESVTLENQGQKIFGIFHAPKVQAPYPAVLFCHGLAGHKTGRFRIYVEIAERLTKEGIAVLRVDFRGSGDSEGQIADMTLTGEIEDAILAFNWMKAHSGVNSDRLGIFGRSLGGSVAALTASEVNLCKSLALWAPIFNADQWRDKWRLVEHYDGHPEDHAELRTINGQVVGLGFYQELFRMDMPKALENLKNVPLLHLHGLKDEIISPVQADHFEMAREGSPSKFMLFDESDHDFSHSSERKIAIDETVEWFKKTLKET